MSFLDNILRNSLEYISEGIVIINKNLQIIYWNPQMEYLTKINKKDAIYNHLYQVIPSLNKQYFISIIDTIFIHNRNMFLSAALHKDLLNFNCDINLKLSKIQHDFLDCILIEFINVTNQYLRIKQLKQYVRELYVLNTELKEKEQLINRIAYYDHLTGLINRTLFFSLAKEVLDEAEIENHTAALMFIDIDKFKVINDSYGHKIGDDVLIHVANVLKTHAGEESIVARFGGDEFLILLPSVSNYDASKKIAVKINQNISDLCCNGHEIKISVSIGISIIKNNCDIDKLIILADKAMYKAKEKGGNGYFIDFN